MTDQENVGPVSPPAGGGAPPGAIPPPPPGGGTSPPGGQAPPPGAPANPLPWEDRARLGWVKAFLETVRIFATAPRDAYGRASEKGDYASPLIWVAVIGLITSLVQWFWVMVWAGSPLGFLPAELSDRLGPLMTSLAAGGGLIAALASPLLAIIAVFIWGAILHVCLLLVDGLRDSRAGFEGTLRAVGYAHLGQAGRLVPFVGGLIALVWSVFLVIVGLSTIHRTTTGKAVVAALIPFLLCCAIVTVLVASGLGLALLGLATGHH